MQKRFRLLGHYLISTWLLTLLLTVGVQAKTKDPNPAASPSPKASATPPPDSSASDEDEMPELPDSELVPPPEDDKNTRPIEDDFTRMAPPPGGFNPIFWRLELRNQLEFNSNVDQVANSPSSPVNRAMLTGIFRYTFPSNTQILLRSQLLNFSYLNPTVSDRNQLLALPLSVTASQWFMDRLNVYLGFIPVWSTSLNRPQGNVQRFDQNYQLGATYYNIIDSKHILFGGYQLDFLNAAAPTSAYLGNMLMGGYRHSLGNNMFWFLDARAQYRIYTANTASPNDFRIGAGTSLQWHIMRPWLMLEARADYNQVVNSSVAARNAGIFSIGLNLVGALQSQP